jgi:hypothetical protein
MAGIMPDGGVGPSGAPNSISNANLVDGCDSLWHANRCIPRFDPASANAVISELLNAMSLSEIDYDCSTLDNLADAIRIHEISGNTSFSFSEGAVPISLPAGSDKKIGGGSFLVPNTYHRAIRVFMYADTTYQLDLDDGGSDSRVKLEWRINDSNSFLGVAPFLTYAKGRNDDTDLINNVFARVYNIPPGGRQFFWEARSTQSGTGSWKLQYTETALAIRLYGTSAHTRDVLEDYSPPDA